MRRTILPAALALVVGGSVPACTGGGDDDDGAAFPGVWQYEPGSFSFVNCFISSTTVDLTRSGFQIVDEAGSLVRVNPDGCRFSIVPTTARHATGAAGEECTVHGTDLSGNPVTTLFRVESLLLELDPGDGSRMIEVFGLAARQTYTTGTIDCEITGNNTLDRAP